MWDGGGRHKSSLWTLPRLFCLMEQVSDWLHIDISTITGNIFNRFLALELACKSRFLVDTRWLFGLAFCWNIWNCRNEIIFIGGTLVHFDTLGKIKFVSWEWFLYFYKVRDSLVWTDWCVNSAMSCVLGPFSWVFLLVVCFFFLVLMG